ncbi:flagellar biosynthesis protein FlhA [Candidatus Uabimicrobium amorphum]|uniref:Flagellar biosynthesis protein FlhA n=2 Tax=Uabimicrobium amorphum TaxID=2596890 RepID=A0A5S9IQU5_UABAM|nr:flagellar biosynthesis protein FlhA [Candidatus Uabimicrobium amorphum]
MTRISNLLRDESDILLVGVIVGILLILIVPFPPEILDFLICLSISTTVLLLLITLNIRQPLEFSSFPSILLIITLFRLSLNVASTRLILLHGDAGSVIQAFGFFVVGGDPIVGMILFTILIIIQFIVITKGASRISEVAARFTLDAMPGKQMSIDADLNAGAITEDAARERRKEITQEAEFYGAMDGSSKFVRGDAVAGIIIIIVNILGGIILGIMRGMSIGEAVKKYVILTVGDGLVSQIPALLIAVTTGILITKTSSNSHLANEIKTQLTRYPRTLAMTTAVILLFSVMPGLPFFPFFIMAMASGLVFYNMQRTEKKQREQQEPEQITEDVPQEPSEEQWLRLDRLRIELGYKLVEIADTYSHPTLMSRIVSLRQQLAQEYGIVIPPVHVIDNIQLPPNNYRILMEGEKLAENTLYPDLFLVIGEEESNLENDIHNILGNQDSDELVGIKVQEPAFGIPAKWVDSVQKDKAEMLGYTVINPASVLVTHLSETIKKSAYAILSRDDVQFLVDVAEKNYPILVKNTIPDQVSLVQLHQVLQSLLLEQIPILNLPRILESLSKHITKTKDMAQLVTFVRQDIAISITSRYQSSDGSLPVITLAPENEQTLREVITSSSKTPLAPDFLQKLVTSISSIKQQNTAVVSGLPILLVSADVRYGIRELINHSLPDVPVLSFQEVMSVPQIQCIGVVQI